MRPLRKLPTSAPRRPRERGISMIEGLVALAILAVGVLAMTNLQGTMVSTSANAQYRSEAAYYAEQIIGLATADATNAGCYATTATSCGSTLAATQAQAWIDELQNRLPGSETMDPVVTYTAATGQFDVVIRWKAASDDTTRNITITTVIR